MDDDVYHGGVIHCMYSLIVIFFLSRDFTDRPDEGKNFAKRTFRTQFLRILRHTSVETGDQIHGKETCHTKEGWWSQKGHPQKGDSQESYSQEDDPQESDSQKSDSQEGDS
jgi:hypothetical protein